MKPKNIAFQKKIDAIYSSQKSNLDKVAAAFHAIVKEQVVTSQREQELLQAMGDQQSLIKEQIKMSTLEHATSIFDQCYQRATGNIFPAEEADNE